MHITDRTDRSAPPPVADRILRGADKACDLPCEQHKQSWSVVAPRLVRQSKPSDCELELVEQIPERAGYQGPETPLGELRPGRFAGTRRPDHGARITARR